MNVLRRVRWFRVSLAAAALGALFWGLNAEKPSSLTEMSENIQRPGLELMVNRVWIDRLPRNERDMINQLLFIQQDSDRIGAVVRASVWRRFIELNRWKPNKNGVELHFPQSDRKLKVGTRAYPCKGKAPEPFELCLDITVVGQTRRLYSMKEWKIDATTPDDISPASLPITPDATVEMSGEQDVVELIMLNGLPTR